MEASARRSSSPPIKTGTLSAATAATTAIASMTSRIEKARTEPRTARDRIGSTRGGRGVVRHVKIELFLDLAILTAHTIVIGDVVVRSFLAIGSE